MGDIVRVVLYPKGVDGAFASDRQITLDLAIDAGGSAVGPFPAFGRIGDFKRPETIYPFTLMGDGRLDYGAHAGDVAQDMLAIRAATLTPGGEIVRTVGNHQATFVIATVNSLTAA
ncbi:MAG: hypothetical protein WC804_01060 [Sphingomonas sp.]|uniref:hypothetical protein n=1 Tax=Sphingomonas sp. TaxID=28214 RepID=UPI00356ADE46